MSGLDKDRFRNKTVAFRVSYEERKAIESRITISGLPKGKYFILSALREPIAISVGKFESDKLSIELKRLREALQQATSKDDEIYEAITNCRIMFEQMLAVLEENYDDPGHRIRAELGEQ